MTDSANSAERRMMAMLHHRTRNLKPGDSVAEPLVPASVFHLPETPDPNRVYGRLATPTVQAAEARLSLLEDAPTLLFSSGMAAYSALVLATLKEGDTVLMLSDGYYAARNMLTDIFASFGVETILCPAEEFNSADLSGIRLVIVETPTNPHLDVIDLARLSARCKAKSCLLAVDNTVCTALLQQPLDLGADIVISSDTKAAAGHSDLLLGHLSARDQELMEAFHKSRSLAGAIPGAFDAWLLVRGLETLDVRLERMCANAQDVADLMQGHAAVQSIRYPGLKGDPSATMAEAQMAHPGFLIGVSFADQQQSDRFIEASGVFVPATSFGGVHSSADRRARWGDDVSDGFLRLSLGCEPRQLMRDAVAKGLAVL